MAGEPRTEAGKAHRDWLLGEGWSAEDAARPVLAIEAEAALRAAPEPRWHGTMGRTPEGTSRLAIAEAATPSTPGLDFSDQELRDLAAGGAMFRPHVVVALLDRLAATERSLAIAEGLIERVGTSTEGEPNPERAPELSNAMDPLLSPTEAPE